MKNVYKSLRKIVLSLIFSLIAATAISQPAHYQGFFNNSYTSVSLTDLGEFRQYRHTSTASSTGDMWAFRNATSTGYWADNLCLGLGIPGYNQVIVPVNPKTYGFAEYTTSCYDYLPAITNGYYYTFNITEKSTPSSPVNEDMAVLETSYNPVSISAISKSPSSPNSADTVTVTATTSASLSTGEYLYLRYSTSSTFSSSTVVAFSMSGTSGTAKIPPQAGGATIYYYVFSSNRTSSQLATEVSSHGQVAYNLLTLNLNNNGTSNYNYVVNSCATAPTAITSSVAGCLKSGRSTTLTRVGGTLPSGGSFKWYEGSCGAGTSIGTGNTVTVSPTSTTNYYVRAEDGCGNTVCASFTVIVGDSSVAPTSITSVDTICQNVLFKLKQVGGTLGSGASWQWYRVGCGGPGIPWVGTGDSIFTQMDPGISYYHVKAIGTCNTTSCTIKAVVIRDSSVRPTEAPTATICLGSTKVFGINGGTPGGSLGHGAQWKWYSGSCGGTLVGTGSTLSVSPSATGTYTYYRRAEGTCNTTTCATYTLTVTDSSVTPTSISGPSSVCERSASLVFKPVGGTKSPGASWTWTRVACHGSPGQVGLGSGDSLVLTTAALGVGTHTIYVRGLNGCNTTNCVSKTFTISDTSVPASSISGTSTICLGQSSTLTFSGGKLGAGASWKWYEGGCGGTSIATGTSYVASPTVAGTYTYYLRAEGTCNNTVCQSFTMTVRDTSVPATSVTTSASTICLGQTVTLTANGGSLGHAASWNWYSGSCGGTSIGTGASITWGPPVAGSVTVYGRAEGTCNNTVCKSVTITVRDTSVPATAIVGIDTICQNVTFKLKRSGGSLGYDAKWNWYRTACGGSGVPWVGTGDSITTQMDPGTSYYYLKAEGFCNNTVCAVKTVFIRDSSVRPTEAPTATICLGSTKVFGINGGTPGGKLGHGAQWKWYSGSCGGTLVGTGSTLSVSPSATGSYTYYRRAEGTCNTTTCATYTLTVTDSSVTPTSISGSSSYCERSASLVFKPVGGTKSAGASWTWTRVACHGSPGQVGLGSGDSLVLTTAALGVGTHTIYVRGLNGCNTTNCVSKTFTISDTSVPASSISGTSTICLGQSSTLTFSGGKLGAGASWKWYQGNCGGTAIATGTSYVASPTAAGTYTYYLRAEGTCNNTLCKSFTLTVRDTSVPATSVAGTKTTFCLSDTSLLTLSGGSLGTGASWKWYIGSCSGISIGNGTSHIASPNQGGTFTYYVRAEGTCNNTVCKTITLTVRDSSVPASSISGTSTICKGQSSTLSLNGGSLGTGGTWKWYLGNCSGTSIATGSTFTASPAAAGTYTYYVRAEGTCNNTACRSFTLTVNDTSTPATSATATSTTICKGQSTTLSKNGGSLGTGATWEWYSGSCTGTPVGSGSSLSVTPSVTTTYYVKAKGTCNTTSCQSVTITVRDTSVPAVSISGTNTICKGQSTTFTLNGGSLGTGGSWKWYSGSCGGTSAGTGTTLTVSPSAGTFTFYVRAEGTCNNTACKSITLTVNDTSVPATSATATSTTICKGQSTTLSKNGGSLGTGATWEWYSGSCTGTPVGSGSSLSVTPTTTTTYYIKAEGTCNNTSCQSVTITVRDTSTPATVVTGTASTICKGESVTLTINGGSLGTGGSWKWYSGSCGGTSAGTGSSLTLSPQSTTTYYVRAEGTCNNTSCKSYTVTVRDTSVPALSATANSTSICQGQGTTLNVSGGSLGTGASWKWYSGSCSGTSIGTGSSLSVTPTVTTTYFVRAEGTCNNTICKNVTVTVKDTSIAPSSISGPSSVCERSASLVFKPVGGRKSAGATWTWTRVACHGSPGQVGLGSGDSVVLTTAALGVGTHTIYVRGLNGCNTTNCVSKTFTISDTSVPASSISGTATICLGQSSTLSSNGGKLGAGASWKWYSGSCGGTSVATGSSYAVSPLAAGTYTYYLRAEGTCNSTTCKSFTLTVRDTSVPATSISGTTTICRGQSTTFTLSGGSLGTGGSWKWYTSSCGGTSITTGTSLTVTPAAGTYTYYVRAEGTCNNTACRNITLTVRDTSVPATGISGTSTICRGQSSTLTLNGGSLGTGGSWKWYLGSCSGTSVATGNSLIAAPATAGTYTYYVRAEGTCNNTVCRSFTLTVNDTSTPASSATVTNSSICKGSSTTLNITGGSLGTGGSWKWYTSSCGGTSAGTGSSLSVTPNSSTTYFVRAEGTCNTTLCRSVTVTVKDTNIPPSSISGPTSVCQRSAPMVFKPVGGTLSPGASWTWTRVACHGSPGQVGLGSGDSISLTTGSLSVGSHTIYVRALNGCNTTKCVSMTFTISDTSLPASSVTGTSTICAGQSTTLTVNGGKLGAGATWNWYNGSCGGTSVGTGTTLIATPAAVGTYTYYVRAEGNCNKTACQSFTLTVRDTSHPVVSILGNTTICNATSTTLTTNGGSLASGASWKWYSGSCGGSFVGTGTSITVAPSSTTTYFVRAEGTCKNSPCKSVTVTVRDTSVPATSITGTTTICKGSSTTLSVTGGSLGTGASWKWYSGSCAGTPVGTGSSVTLSPSGNTTYFVRAESSCNTTNCVSISINVRDTSVPASSIVALATNLCKGQTTTMFLTGGSLGHNASWKWYEGSCGGTSIGSGTSIIVAPSAGLKTYYVRAEGTCNNTACVSQSINIKDTSEPAASINATLTTVCAGSTTVLTPNGGYLGTAANWKWYLGSCGSGLVSTGSSLSLTPSVGGDYTYYLRAEGSCNTTKCVSITIKVLDVSKPGSISGSGSICLGSTNTLTVNGGALGTGASWKWYTGTCGGTPQGTGSTLSVRPVSPGVYTYFVRAEGSCNTTPCASFTFTVADTNKPAVSISGPLAVCPGNIPFTLRRVGGSLASSGARWDWYREACGGPGVPWVGTGDSITLRPSQLSIGNHVFYLKANGGCNNTACVTFVLNIRQTPVAPSHISGTTNICKGQSTTLSVNGGVQGTDATWTWYSGSCGGTPVGTGASITVSPTDTTTYFVRSEGPCAITGCAQVRVDVIHTPVAPVSITANYNQACAGTPVKLYANGPALLSGETRRWYINNGGTLTPIGEGDSITVTLSTTSDIELRTENRCFNGASVTKQISILNSPVGTWVGVKNSSWHESDNWCGGIPTASTDVVIPSGTPNQPVITANAAARNLTINAGADLNVSSTGKLNLNGSFTKSGTFTSTGLVAFRSGGAVTSDGFTTRNLEVNLSGEVAINNNINVTGELLLGNGSVVTGNNEVNVTNDNANAVKSIAGNTNYRNGWVAGNLRRSIKTVDSTYHFPVGNIAGGNNAEFVNHNVAGVTSILASIKPKAGSDVGLNVVETATSNPYGSVSNGGVWYLEPNGTVTGGNFDLKLWFHNQATFTTGLVNNSFSILNRPVASAIASDWTKPATNSTYVAGSVGAGYVQRNGINAMGQFGIGLTLYPVKTSRTGYASNISISPNPFNAEFAVSMNIPKTAQVSVNVYDQAGRLVVQQDAGRLSGINSLKVNAGNLSEGTYTVVLKGDGQTLHTEKMIKILK